MIGTDGPDIGTGWTVAGIANATKDRTLVRKCNVIQGNTDWLLSSGTDAQNSEWLVRNNEDWLNLAQHDNSCIGTYSYGCLDSLASNYDATVAGNDGSCIYPGCTDPAADNYSFPSFSGVDGTTGNTADLVYLSGSAVDDGSCLYYGCTDPNALNYDSLANMNAVSASDSSSPCNYFCDSYVVTPSTCLLYTSPSPRDRG